MNRDLFFKRSISLFIFSTGLVVGQSILASILNTMVIYVSFLLLFFYRTILIKGSFLIQIVSYLIFFAYIISFFASKFDMRQVIIVIYWGIVSVVPQFILGIDREKIYWRFILCFGVVNTIALVLARTDSIAIFFLMCVISLIFVLYSGQIYFGNNQGKQSRLPLISGTIMNLLLALPGGLLIGALIFFFFPRIQSFPFHLGLSSPLSRVGYSGTVNLADSRSLSESREVIMYVQAKESEWLRKEGPELLLRGSSLNFFDGKSWVKKTSVGQSKIEGSKTNFRDTKLATIHRINFSSAVLFYPGKYLGVWFFNPELNERFDQVSGDLEIIHRTESRYSYSVLFQEYPSIDSLQKILIPEERSENLQKIFTELTEIPPIIKEAPWFRALMSQMGISQGEEVGTVVRKINYFFKQNYQVSLEMSQNGQEALKIFLTQTKKGHCEFFATSAALFLRSLGIPSRLVVGYKGGVYNSLIEHLEVRSRDAHAWVELWIPQYGWIPFDPTPGEISQESLMSNVMLYVNAIDFLLKRYVSGYDGQIQREIFESVADAVKTQDYSLKGILDFLKKSSFFTGGLAVLLLLFLVAGRSPMVAGKPRSETSIYPFFDRFLRKKGFVRKTGETYRNFHARLFDLGFEDKDLEDLTSLVEKYLYSSQNEKIFLHEIKILTKKLTKKAHKKKIS